jgi:signal transduction histidine kinase/CheY-like chemotaxis protein
MVVGTVAAAAALRVALDPVLHDRGVFLLFLIAVAVCAHFAGFWAGFASAWLGVAGAVSLQVLAPGGIGLQGWVQVALFMAIALPVSVLGGRLRSALDREHRLLESESSARAEAERASRVKDEFLAVLSHELRSPLNAIVGWAHVLKGMRLPPEADRAVQTILRNADHQVSLMAEISDLSRIVTGKLVLEEALVDVRSALDHAVDAVRLAADARGQRLQLLIPETPLVVRGDASRLQQVFWNLLSNAIKFSPAGASIQASATREGDTVSVEVSDTGQGIGPGFLPHVFESFRQEDSSLARRHGGLGLGLAIVRRLTEAHGGAVRAHSDGSGKGTTFTVELPAFPGTSTEAASADIGRPQLAGVRILIVEDDLDTRDLLTRVLGELGAEVVAASSAAEARTRISMEVPDAIVSDIGMPGEDGLAFMRALRQRPEHRHIPAIALSAYASAADHAEALAAGYHEHVPKPVQPYRLARVIVASLNRPS